MTAMCSLSSIKRTIKQFQTWGRKQQVQEKVASIFLFFYAFLFSETKAMKDQYNFEKDDIRNYKH
jgi:hypothetical protein